MGLTHNTYIYSSTHTHLYIQPPKRDAAVSALAREKEGQAAMRVEMESLLGELKAAGYIYMCICMCM